LPVRIIELSDEIEEKDRRRGGAATDATLP
jgi:hypothetical protein